VKQILQLQKKSYRDESGLFIVEGKRELLRALEQGVEIEKIFYSKPDKEILDLAIRKKIEQIPCTEKAFAKISYRENPDGILAIAKKPFPKDLKKALLTAKKGCFLICVGIEKPGNLGAMLRSADAAGALGIIICDPHVDLYNPNVVRASMGTLFSVPLYSLSSEEAIQLLKDHNVKIVAATPHQAKNYTDISYPNIVAVAMGKEQTGLSPFWLENADIAAQIPMKGIADSLNVASAATLFLYEIYRQHTL